jgi:endonuclease I
MKKLLSFILLIPGCCILAQVPAYYNGVNFTLSGLALKTELADHITSTHTNPITYDEVWTVLQVSDLDPTNSADVLLAYGYNDVDGNVFNDRTRIKTNYGGSSGQWNREHTFAKSLGNPDLGTSGPGSDAHNLRASDVDMNNMRGNLLFADGSGNAADLGSEWYPGDEWKGDCARIIMYMYLRYGLQCRPYYCVVGTVNSVDANMVNLLLEWNVEDPVSVLEENRNDEIQSWQGNRNPFIDNPYLATKIWGGTPAVDTWGGVGLEESEQLFTIYPNPVMEDVFYVSVSDEKIDRISIYDTAGKLIYTIHPDVVVNSTVSVQNIPSGMWLIQVQSENAVYTQKLIIP